MLDELIVAGSGGQGVLLLGEILAVGSLYMGKNATWMPSYGPEMRGGTANCSVVLSTQEIGSPMVEEPSILVAFNRPSVDKFLPAVQKGGLVFIEAEGVEERTVDGVEIVYVPAAEEARKLGNVRTANMIMLGAIMAKTNLLDMEHAEAALRYIWGPAKTEKLLPLNRKALQRGMELVK